jgi:hypothetical protein
MRKLCIALGAAALAACVTAAVPAPAPGPGKARGNGPPPHAPAHGYRAKTPQGVDVVFDTTLGVYVVLSVPGQYWLDERYYRKRSEGWFVGPGVEGPWTVCATADLPAGLRGNGSPGKGKGKAKNGNGPPSK